MSIHTKRLAAQRKRINARFIRHQEECEEHAMI